MSRPRSDEPRHPREPEPYGVSPVPPVAPGTYGSVPYGTAPPLPYGTVPPAPYGTGPQVPYGSAAPASGAPAQPIRRSGWRTFWSIFVHELRETPRAAAEDLMFQLVELVVNVVVAAAVVGAFALVGYAVAGSTGAIIAGLIGFGVFLVVRILMYVGVVVGGIGWLVLSKKNRG